MSPEIPKGKSTEDLSSLSREELALRATKATNPDEVRKITEAIKNLNKDEYFAGLGKKLGCFSYEIEWSTRNLGGIGGGSSSKKITCEVTVANPIARDSRIETYACNVVGKCGLFGFSTAKTLAFADSLTLTFSSGGEKTSTSFQLGESDRVTKTLSLCVEENVASGTLRLSGPNADIETKNVNL